MESCSNKGIDMPAIRRQLLIAGSIFCLSLVAVAEEAKVEAVVLLNPNPEFQQRASDAKTIASYIKVIEREALASLEQLENENHSAGIIVVAIRPKQQMKLWIDLDGKSKPQVTDDVQERMATKGVPIVVGGPVAFVLQLRLSGKTDPDQPAAARAAASIPEDWRRVLDRKRTQRLKIPDDVLPLVWPDNEIAVNEKMEQAKTDAANSQTFVPEGFVLQSLHPTGGSVPRPTDWHYQEAHRKRQLTWTISKEPSAGGYVTGVKIQLFIGVAGLTKQTPQEFLERFLKSKADSVKVLSRREPIKQGAFTRVGLETEEPQADEDQPPFRILYSCFWANDLDMAAITISGTTSDLWETHQDAFNVMSALTLIDLEKAKRATK